VLRPALVLTLAWLPRAAAGAADSDSQVGVNSCGAAFGADITPLVVLG